MNTNLVDHWQDVDLGELSSPRLTAVEVYLALRDGGGTIRKKHAKKEIERILATNGITSLLYAVLITKRPFYKGVPAIERLGLGACYQEAVYQSDTYASKISRVLAHALDHFLIEGSRPWLTDNIERITRIELDIDIDTYANMPDKECTIKFKFHFTNAQGVPRIGVAVFTEDIT